MEEKVGEDAPVTMTEDVIHSKPNTLNHPDYLVFVVVVLRTSVGSWFEKQIYSMIT